MTIINIIIRFGTINLLLVKYLINIKIFLLTLIIIKKKFSLHNYPLHLFYNK